jgi:arylsulfatase A-like enzyme
MPHYPYAYERDCGIRPLGNGWLEALDRSLAPRWNDDASRGLRYPLYLDQLICTNNTVQHLLEKLSHQPWWDDAIVVVHGDHGSRIDRGPPRFPTVQDMVAQDFMDAFATLFAIKHPDIPAGYDRRQLPVGHLFQRMVRDGRDPGHPDLEDHPRVLVQDGEKPMVEMSLPFFDHGLPLGDSADGQ